MPPKTDRKNRFNPLKQFLYSLFYVAVAGLCSGLPVQAIAQSQTPVNTPERAPASAAEVDPRLRQRLITAIEKADSFDDRFHAEVWLMDMSNRLSKRVNNIDTRLKLLRSIHREASRAELPPELVIAVIDIESRFDHFAISRAGAQGLMQVMPFWLKEIGRADDNLMDIDTNLRMGCTILKYYLDMEKGNIRRALARYNGSLGRWVYPDKVIKVLNKHWYRS